MVCRFSPNHRKKNRNLSPFVHSWDTHSKLQFLQMICEPFILPFKFYSKVCAIHLLCKISDFQSIFDCTKISTDLAKWISVIQTFSRHKEKKREENKIYYSSFKEIGLKTTISEKRRLVWMQLRSFSSSEPENYSK